MVEYESEYDDRKGKYRAIEVTGGRTEDRDFRGGGGGGYDRDDRGYGVGAGFGCGFGGFVRGGGGGYDRGGGGGGGECRDFQATILQVCAPSICTKYKVPRALTFEKFC